MAAEQAVAVEQSMAAGQPVAAGRAAQPAARSLRTTLLVLMVAVFAAVFALELVLATRSLDRLSRSAYDRSLLGALKAIDANVSTESGGLAVELPYRMLEFFELTASGPVYFRVATEDRLAEIGTHDLPLPAEPLASGVPVFYEADYDGRRMRFGAYARPLRRTLYPTPDRPGPQRIVIQVGEAVDSREAFTRGMLRQVIARDLLVMALGGVAIVAAVLIALRPLARVRRELAARSDDDLEPLRREAVPAEVRPLVEALNLHVARHARLAEAQRHFLDDASHQLRTPLAVLRAQIDSALRDGGDRREVLAAMAAAVERATRVTDKLLQLARARDAAHRGRRDGFQSLDAALLAEEVARALLPLAHRRGIDFGFEPAGAGLAVDGDPVMLGEALSNLVENAIRHTPAGGRITVRAGRQGPDRIRLGVEDDGPGMPAAARAVAGRRFAGQSGSGGLGLAIAGEVALLHGGRLVLEDGPGGRGLAASLDLPASGDPPPSGRHRDSPSSGRRRGPGE